MPFWNDVIAAGKDTATNVTFVWLEFEFTDGKAVRKVSE